MQKKASFKSRKSSKQNLEIFGLKAYRDLELQVGEALLFH
jgi:hypothetical protein